MKKLYLFSLMFIMGSILLFAQDELTKGELNFRIINNGGSATIEIEMELVSSLCWNADVYNPDIHNITNLFNGGTISGTVNNDWFEFLACWETTVPNYYRTFGLGYYKFTGRVNGVDKDYFYIDYRTSDLPENFNSGGSGDINITFNISDGKFYYYLTQTLFPTQTSIWAEKAWIDNIKTELEPLEPENLVGYDINDHPWLQWTYSSDPGDYVTHYEIHRNTGQGWDLIATISSYYLYYADTEIDLEGPPEPLYLYYMIRPKNGDRVSDEFSNTYRFAGPSDFGKYSAGNNSPGTAIIEYKLEQNYPNPFNPRTTIAFSLKENSLVTLKVFDILGREVAVLVNELLTAGNHQVQFDAIDLESGVYFYEIRAGNFRDVKKLILTK